MMAVALILIGLGGTLLPVLPGTPFVFLGLWLAAWIEGFQKVGLPTIVILGGLTLLSIGIDFLASALGAKKMGASKAAVAGAALGTFFGLFLGLPGLIAGPFVGAVVAEFLSQGDVQQAGRAGWGTWLGLMAGALAKITLIFIMLGVFITAYLV